MTQSTVASQPTRAKAWLLFYFSALLALFFVSEHAFAAGKDLGGVADQVTSSMKAVAKLITAASYVAGIGFALSGMVKFKAHKDNPTQVPLSAPIVLLVIAAGLVFLPSIIQTAGQTLFDSSGEIGGSSGAGVDQFDK